MVGHPTPQVQEKLRQLHILAPTDPQASQRWSPAPRLASLHGKAGGFLGNRKDNAGLLLATIKELLDRRYELRDTLVLDKYIYSRPASDEVLNELGSRCDFVVTAIAD